MTITDDDLRAAVAARVALAPEPLTPDGLRARWDRPRPADRTDPFPRRALAAAAALVLVVASVIAIGSRGRDPGPSDGGTVLPSGPTVGRYFLPTVLPPSYELLSFTEQPGDPDQVDPARSVWRHVPTGQLVGLAVTQPFADQSSNTLPLDGGGMARWGDRSTELPTMTPFPISFTVERADGFVTGTAASAMEEPVLRKMLAAVHVEDGLPVIVDDDFELVSSRPELAAPVAATWTATYGPRGGYTEMGGVLITATRASTPIDVPLQLGVWSETVERNGRTVHTGFMGMSPEWFVSDDVSVQVVGDGDVVVDVLAGLVEIDTARLVEEVIPSIEPDPSNMPPAGRIEFAGGVVAEFFGAEDSPRGVCLAIDGRRRCDLTLRSRAGFAEDGRTLLQVDVDLLVDGRWFTVGVRAGSAVVDQPVPDGAELVDVGTRVYYLVERPADAAVVPAGDLWSRVRPSR